MTVFDAARPRFVEQYEPIIRSYCECNAGRYRIAVVYVYLDEAVRKALKYLSEIGSDVQLAIPTGFDIEEETVKDFLRQLTDEVSRSLPIAVRPPQFHFIGLQELKTIIRDLRHINPALPRYLSSPLFTFTYDSPKFVEAVIRLARSETPHLADYPVLRVDEDTMCNAEFIDKLVGAYLHERVRELVFFFSGTYGSFESRDLLNDYAVRTHWFADINAPPGSQLEGRAGQLARTFLADLNELGATQLADSEAHYSRAMRTLLGSGAREEAQPKRNQPQVVSGAGLIMSSRAISALPPFMHFRFLTTWVDDHLKRRLHEIIGDLAYNRIESVAEARIVQNRHPRGVTLADIKWAEGNYFERLLRGCLLRSLITSSDGQPTEYSLMIGEIVKDQRDSVPKAAERRQLQASMREAAFRRLEEVIVSWTSEEFDPMQSHAWATLLSTSAKRKEEYVEEVVQDATDYIRLVADWPVFVRTIRRLPYGGLGWLFQPVRSEPPVGTSRA